MLALNLPAGGGPPGWSAPAPHVLSTPVIPMGGPPPMSSQPPVKVSLEHNKREQYITGHNIAAQPFRPSKPTVQDLQYNSPAALYSRRNAADEYLHQTGGLFGTDPKLTQEPAYLKSGALQLIQESEGRGGGGHAPPRSNMRGRSPVPGHYPHGPHSHLDEEEYAHGRAETLRHTTAAGTQSGSFNRLTSALRSE